MRARSPHYPHQRATLLQRTAEKSNKRYGSDYATLQTSWPAAAAAASQKNMQDTLMQRREIMSDSMPR